VTSLIDRTADRLDPASHASRRLIVNDADGLDFVRPILAEPRPDRRRVRP
jgi:hypothetical protein